MVPVVCLELIPVAVCVVARLRACSSALALTLVLSSPQGKGPDLQQKLSQGYTHQDMKFYSPVMPLSPYPILLVLVPEGCIALARESCLALLDAAWSGHWRAVRSRVGLSAARSRDGLSAVRSVQLRHVQLQSREEHVHLCRPELSFCVPLVVLSGINLLCVHWHVRSAASNMASYSVSWCVHVEERG